MQRIVLFLSIMFIAFTACKNDDEALSPEIEEQEVEMVFSAPRTYSASSERSASENIINELDLLVFKNGEYQYRRKGYKSGNSFRSTLKIDSDITIYFLANCRAFVEGNDAIQEGNDWKNDIQPALQDLNPQRLVNNQDALPMWGIMENITITEGIVNKLGNVFLLRSVASVDLNIAVPESKFRLEEAYIYFAPDRGYLAPYHTTLENNNEFKYTAAAPTLMQTNLRLHWNVPQDNAILNKFYLYDNNASVQTLPAKRFSRLVVGGYYEGSQAISYYPIDFMQDEQSIQIVRNTKYYINVVSVTGEGYPDPDTGSEQFPVGMNVNIIDWNLNDHGDIAVDGYYYLSLERRKVELLRDALSVDSINISTNLPSEKITMEFQNTHNGATAKINNGVQNNRFRAELVEDSTGDIVWLRFTALSDYSENNLATNNDILMIKAGRIEFTISVIQLDKLYSDWDLGGDDGITVGKKKEKRKNDIQT